MSFKAIKVILSAGAALSLSALPGAAQAKDKPPVIEVVTLNLKHGVTPAQFDPVDRGVQTAYISK